MNDTYQCLHVIDFYMAIYNNFLLLISKLLFIYNACFYFMVGLFSSEQIGILKTI